MDIQFNPPWKGLPIELTRIIIKEVKIGDSLPILERSYNYYSQLSLNHEQKRATEVLSQVIESARLLEEPYQVVLFIENERGYLKSLLVYYLSDYSSPDSATKEKVIIIPFLASFSSKSSVPLILHVIRVAKKWGANRILVEPLDEEARQMYLKVGFSEDPNLDVLSRKI